MSNNNLFVVKAPLSGTFYEAPSPDDPPYVEIGKAVKRGDVICIVESMKVFTEIRAEREGTVKTILVEDEDPVDRGQVLIEIELN